MTDKTIINNWTGGGTLQTWTDGEWQILYVKDSAGNCITLSLNSSEAAKLAYAISPIPNEQFERLRAANSAVYELSYPKARADELRQIADEIECDSGCEGCSQQKIERGEFCGFIAADSLRKLATALDLKAKVDAEPAPQAVDAEAVAKLINPDAFDPKPDPDEPEFWRKAARVLATEAVMPGERRIQYAEGEAPWSEDEQFSEAAKACKDRCMKYSYRCGQGGEEEYEYEGQCDECEIDALEALREKYSNDGASHG